MLNNWLSFANLISTVKIVPMKFVLLIEYQYNRPTLGQSKIIYEIAEKSLILTKKKLVYV